MNQASGPRRWPKGSSQPSSEEQPENYRLANSADDASSLSQKSNQLTLCQRDDGSAMHGRLPKPEVSDPSIPERRRPVRDESAQAPESRHETGSAKL